MQTKGLDTDIGEDKQMHLYIIRFGCILIQKDTDKYTYMQQQNMYIDKKRRNQTPISNFNWDEINFSLKPNEITFLKVGHALNVTFWVVPVIRSISGQSH